MQVLRIYERCSGLGQVQRRRRPIREIVDANLKTRIDNLYVWDCSVIPEAFGLPPNLTLVALGKRLARHLVAEQHPAALAAAAMTVAAAAS
jgi:choline dehydrogenase-like flavoprotein